MSYDLKINFGIKFEGTEFDKIADEIFLLGDNGGLIINDDELDRLSEDDYKRFEQHIKRNSKTEIKKDVTKRMNFLSDFENYEHGIMSAFLLMKTVRSFSSLKFMYNDFKDLNKEELDVVKFAAMDEILSSVSNHTSPNYRVKSISETNDFLILIDELEEFSRISRANQNRQFIEEFCKTELYFDEDWFQVDFIFDNEKIETLNPEFAFKGRCKRFLSLFDIPNLDKSLKIRLRCIDRLFGKNDIYSLEISRKYANIIINGEEEDIPIYLNTNVFYAKEEYAKI